MLQVNKASVCYYYPDVKILRSLLRKICLLYFKSWRLLYSSACIRHCLLVAFLSYTKLRNSLFWDFCYSVWRYLLFTANNFVLQLKSFWFRNFENIFADFCEFRYERSCWSHPRRRWKRSSKSICCHTPALWKKT